MSASRFIVLRDEGQTFTAHGSSARSFASEHDADVFAKLLASRYPHQRFVVAKVVGEYATQSAVQSRRLRLVESGT